MRSVSIPALRRIVIHAQGYASRSRAASTREVEATIRRLSCVQLDSISAVERSHRIALASRVGDYPATAVSRLSQQGRVFEYWAHEACLLPVEEWPLFASQMHQGGRRWYGDVGETHPHLAERDPGGDPGARAARLAPLRGRERGRDVELEAGEGDARSALEPRRSRDRGQTGLPAALRPARTGDSDDGARRTRPARVSSACVPCARRPWPRAARSPRRGSSSTGGSRAASPGSGPSVDAPGGGRHPRARRGRATAAAPSSSPAGADLEPPRPSAAVLLSPFDNLLWDRPFARRVLGFDHLIEVYKKEHERRYGYYVLPFLRRDRLVGRADLKSERGEGALVVKAFHREAGVRASGALDDALDRALDRLRRACGLETRAPVTRAPTTIGPWTSRRARSTSARSRISQRVR